MGKGQLIVYNMRYVRLCTLTDNSGVSAYFINEGFSLNEVTELTFKFPMDEDSPKFRYLTNENLVEYNNEFYRIKTTSVQHDDDGKKYIDVMCRHLSESLQYNVLTLEEQTPKTVRELMKVALCYENDSPTLGWSVGTVSVDAFKKRGLEAVEESVFSILVTIAEKYNGLLRFNSKTKTIDMLRIDGDKPPKFDLRISKDLKQVNIQYDTSEMITRLYCFGAADDDGNELNIMSANPTGKAFLENYDYFLNLGYSKDEIAEFPELFVKTTIWRDTNYVDVNDLYEDGVAKLKDMSVPTVTVDINALDLSQFGNYRTSSLSVGDTVKIIDGDIGAEFICNVTAVQRNSEEPHILNISVTNLIQYKDMLAQLFSSVSTANTIISSGGKINGGKVEHIKTYQIDDLSAKYIDAETIKSDYASIKYLDTKYLSADEIMAKYASFDKIEAINAAIENLEVKVLDVTSANIEDLRVQEMYARKAVIDDLEVTNANIKNLNADIATINKALIDVAHIGDLTAINATIKNLNTDIANINTAMIGKADINLANIEAGCIKTGMIDTGAINTAQIADGSITDAKIVGLTANKITAGKLDAAEIEVVNLNAANITVGTINGQQIAPGAIDMDKLGSGVIESIDGAQSTANTAKETADGKNKIWYRTSEPEGTSHSIGDTWFDTDAGYKIYTWDGTKWCPGVIGSGAIDESIINDISGAVNAASGAQTTADGKNTVFRQTSAPTTTGRATGDVWFDTDDGNRIYTWNGSAWASTQMGSSAIADLSIVAAKIAAGTITASQIAGSTITGSKIAAGTISATNLATDSVTSDKIVAGNITTEKLAAKSVTANNMAANSITASNAALADASIVNAKIVDIDAGKIKTGYISADRIEGGSIVIGKLNSGLQTTINTASSTATTADHKADEAKFGLDSLSKNVSENYTNTSTMNATFEDIRQDLSAASIANWCWQNNLTYIDGGKIYAKSVTSQAIDVDNLSAISANLGTVTTGVIQSPNYASGGDGVELDFRDSNNNGLSVRSNTKNTMLKIDADGTRVYSNRDLQNPVAQFVDTGVDVNHVNANSSIIAGMQMTKVGSEVWITSII